MWMKLWSCNSSNFAAFICIVDWAEMNKMHISLPWVPFAGSKFRWRALYNPQNSKSIDSQSPSSVQLLILLLINKYSVNISNNSYILMLDSRFKMNSVLHSWNLFTVCWFSSLFFIRFLLLVCPHREWVHHVFFFFVSKYIRPIIWIGAQIDGRESRTHSSMDISLINNETLVWLWCGAVGGWSHVCAADANVLGLILCV